ncbi:DMT family transporter [Hoeflea sp. CAU 1731]
MSDNATRPTDSVMAGIGWMVLTTLCFACVTGIVRFVGTSVSAPEAAFLRYAFGVLFFLPMLIRMMKRPPKPAIMKLHAIRGTIHGIAVIMWFYAMARLPIAEVTALGYVAPLFVTIGAALFMNEKLHARRITALVVGLLGTMVILRPGLSEFSSGQIAQLCAAPLFATSFLLAKHLTEKADVSEIVLMLSIFCTLILLPFAIFTWTTPSLSDTLWLAITAAVATLGHFTMTRAFRAAPITITQPIQFLQLVWAALIGIILFGEPLDPFVMLGGGIVVAAATFISHREAVAARRLVTPPSMATKD